MTTTVLAWQFLFAAATGLAVCLLVVVVVVLAISFLRSKTNNNDEPCSSTSSSRLLSKNQQVEKEQVAKQEDMQYKPDAWLASLSTPAAYRYMNDPKSKERIRIPPNATKVHLIILVHGWMGRPCSLGYMKDALERQAAAATTRAGSSKKDCCGFIIHAATANQKQTSDGVAAGGCRLAQEVEEILQIIKEQLWHNDGQHHSAPTSNSSSSNIIKGKKRLFISVSFVGHSLGGLYARYAVSKISSLQKTATQEDAAPSKRRRSNTSTSSNSNKGLTVVIIEPAIFCTTCTPHLGLADELLYIPNLPRWLQYILASIIMKQTGQDLFRFTSLLEEMVVESSFRIALGSFQQRITYVNTYGTDFQVPTQTAAFLAPDNNLWHQRQVVVASSSSTTAAAAATNKMISLVVETCPRPMQQQQGQQQQGTITTTTSQQGLSSSTNNKTRPIIIATNAKLAAEMDALGWTKVFCDVRDEIQSFPRFCHRSSSRCSATPPPLLATTPLRSMSAMSCSNTNDSSTSVNSTVDLKDERSKLTLSLGRSGGNKSRENDDDTPLGDDDNDKKNNTGRAASAAETYYSSKELLDRFNHSDINEHRWYVPSAHLVMVASTKREFLVERTAAGRPIMDELASRVVHGILQCENKSPLTRRARKSEATILTQHFLQKDNYQEVAFYIDDMISNARERQ